MSVPSVRQAAGPLGTQRLPAVQNVETQQQFVLEALKQARLGLLRKEDGISVSIMIEEYPEIVVREVLKEKLIRRAETNWIEYLRKALEQKMEWYHEEYDWQLLTPEQQEQALKRSREYQDIISHLQNEINYIKRCYPNDPEQQKLAAARLRQEVDQKKETAFRAYAEKQREKVPA